ncbi:hypothetical protein EVG20_g10917 [Dentipellis fragilis]|uniref:Uncharacterized protein n=1 Tax=Dentipellis fragilis TaxID=205917 RepID=A0A4Y9XQH9_9AGAM|nr:hypothetical protein EVG20_g10917 [Dentipellis fragilis]
MLYHNVLLSLLSITASTSAAPLGYRVRREVPQEHSHNSIVDAARTSLNLNNPAKIQDPIFALLGNAAAAAGAGSITDTDCLQQAVADQAFTNAKAAGDVNGMVNALIFRALERNTGSVGATSANCTSLKAVNPEIAAISQHQDPASPGAAANNKAVVLALAQQIHAVGGDPQDALKSGTFAPGKIGDPTAAGNTCDDANDEPGCIFSQNKLVDDATADEINAAVGGAGSAAAATTAAAVATTSAAAAASTSAASGNNVSSGSAAAGNNAAAASGNIGDFGFCSVPQIEFATGFDNRKETSFQPVDKTSYNHGSAQNIDIITQFMCDTLTNSCKADQTAKDTCATAKTAADGQTKGTGAQADAFNAVFGIKTNFAAVAEVNDQGVTVAAGAGAGTGTGTAIAAATTAAAAATTAAAAATATATATGSNNAASSSAVGDFGSCPVPQIKFAAGLDGRKETAFEPADLNSFNHGSAQNIDIISQFICDQLTNKCKADQTAKDTCQTATAAADAQTKGTGAQADAFNAAFGVQTNFAAVAEVNDQGVTVAAGVGSGAATASAAATQAASAATTTAAAAASSSAAATGSSSGASGGNLQTFTGTRELSYLFI